MWRPGRRRDRGSSPPDAGALGDAWAGEDIPAEALVLPEMVVGIETGVPAGDDSARTFGVAGWTLISRATGLLRVVVVGAILGPTFFANIFQATNFIPNITFNVMAGALLTELCIPLLVAELDKGGIERARKLVREIVGVVLVGFLAVAVLIVLLSPVIVHLLTLGVPDVREASARRECWVLLFLVIPQVGLYGLVAVATAAQNSRHRFALAAAAPALENVGLIATVAIVSVVFGRDTTNVSTGYLVCLGVGATLAVAIHAGVQCFGAARAGLPLWPSLKWDHPSIPALVRRMIPAAGTTSLDAAWVFILIVAAGTVPGGVVAIQVGINFYYMPVALSAKAAGTVLLPRLSREALHNRLVDFRKTYDLGISWSWFVAIPASLALVASAGTLAQAIAFGEMRNNHGVALLSASIAGFGLALLFATMDEFAKQTCYARHDVKAPLLGCVAMVALLLIGSPIAAATLTGPKLLFGLGVVVTVAEAVRAFIIDSAARRGTHAQGSPRLRALVRHGAVALITIGPGALLARVIAGIPSEGSPIVAIIAVGIGIGAGMVGYVVVQAMLDAPELPERLRALRRRRAVSEGAV